MAQAFLKIRGIDPLLFRDGRPFTADDGGLTARSVPLPFPSTVAAFVRTQIGNHQNWNWSDIDVLRRAHTIPVDGPLLQVNGSIALPLPKDALFVVGEKAPVRLEPKEELAGMSDFPDEDLWPVMPREQVKGKAVAGRNFWPVDAMMQWLQGQTPIEIPEIHGLPEEERVGIEINRGTRGAEERKLYVVRLRGFGETQQKGEGKSSKYEYALIARVNHPDNAGINPVGTLGGERRLTAVERIDDTPEAWPRCPEGLKDALSASTRVRMVLATPAHFEHGWKPGWIDKSGLGEFNGPAGIAKVKLKLVGAAVDRRVAVSGWGIRERGPRAIKWLAPAGSVYFFEVESGDQAALWRDAWLEPMSDNEQDRRDGLGLALWGTW